MSIYHKYYDKLYSFKNCAEGSRITLGIAKNIIGHAPRRILDVGCGTGTHSMDFARQGIAVVGTDIEPGFIRVAQRQARSMPLDRQPKFFCRDIMDIKNTNFDLAVSLCNVINYIDQEEYLLKFFKAIRSRLQKRGVFIFDCWNGLAVILDNPRVKKSTMTFGDENITVTITPEKIDLFNQSVRVKNEVRVQRRNHPVKRFTFRYVSTLWTPWHLKNVLQMAGFKIRAISPWMKPQQAASYKTWKITFICQKVG